MWRQRLVDVLPVDPVPAAALAEPEGDVLLLPELVPDPVLEVELASEPDVEPLGDVLLDVLVDGLVLLPVPLLEVVPLVLPPGVGVVVEPVVVLGVVDVELLDSRVVLVSRCVQAAREAMAIRPIAPAWAILKAVMAVPFGKVAGKVVRFTPTEVAAT